MRSARRLEFRVRFYFKRDRHGFLIEFLIFYREVYINEFAEEHVNLSNSNGAQIEDFDLV